MRAAFQQSILERPHARPLRAPPPSSTKGRNVEEVFMFTIFFPGLARTAAGRQLPIKKRLRRTDSISWRRPVSPCPGPHPAAYIPLESLNTNKSPSSLYNESYDQHISLSPKPRMNNPRSGNRPGEREERRNKGDICRHQVALLTHPRAPQNNPKASTTLTSDFCRYGVSFLMFSLSLSGVVPHKRWCTCHTQSETHIHLDHKK
jgi:hypothetical protein